MPPLYVLAVLSLIIALSEWMVRRTQLRTVGVAFLVLVLAAVVANLGGLPTGLGAAAQGTIYDGVFTYGAPLAVFWLLLLVDLRDLLQTGRSLVMLFLIGLAGTLAGVVAGMWGVTQIAAAAPLPHAAGGMLAALFTGDLAAVNELAAGYEQGSAEPLYAASVAVYWVVMALWLIVTLAAPRLLRAVWPRRALVAAARARRAAGASGPVTGREPLHLRDLGVMMALGLGAVWGARAVTVVLARLGVSVPSLLIVALLALLAAQLPLMRRLRGARVLGTFGVYLVLAVIGALCDVSAVLNFSRQALSLLGVALLAVGVHGIVTFGTAWLLQADLDLAAVVSQAQIGGGVSALALARSVDRSDLTLPAVLLGVVGSVIGAFLGGWTAGQLLPLVLGVGS